MIKLVWVTDKQDIVGSSSLENYDAEAAARPEGLDEEISRIFIDDNIVVGRTTLPLCEDYIPAYKSFYVLTGNKNFECGDHDNMFVINDYQELVKKYRNSDDVLLVGGGKATWELFLPYASELIVAVIESHAGDLVFDTWHDVEKTKTKEVDWGNGTTYYYSVTQ